jgi:dTMP kinase
MSKLIQLVGPSGTGKSSICEIIKENLETKGYEVEKLVEPYPLKDLFKSYRLEENSDSWVQSAILATDRLIIYKEKIEPRKNEKNLIFLSDRGLPDNFVYQGFLGGVDIEFIKKLNSFFPLPDLVLAFIVDGYIGYERILIRSKETGEVISKNEFPERINLLSAKYRELDTIYPGNVLKIIDTSSIIDNSLEKTIKYIEDIL